MAAKADMIGYACASATLSHGRAFDRRLCNDIETKSGVPAVASAGAMVEALQRLDISSIGFASPYVKELNHDAVLFFESASSGVLNSANIGSNFSSVEQGSAL